MHVEGVRCLVGKGDCFQLKLDAELIFSFCVRKNVDKMGSGMI